MITVTLLILTHLIIRKQNQLTLGNRHNNQMHVNESFDAQILCLSVLNGVM